MSVATGFHLPSALCPAAGREWGASGSKCSCPRPKSVIISKRKGMLLTRGSHGTPGTWPRHRFPLAAAAARDRLRSPRSALGGVWGTGAARGGGHVPPVGARWQPEQPARGTRTLGVREPSSAGSGRARLCGHAVSPAQGRWGAGPPWCTLPARSWTPGPGSPGCKLLHPALGGAQGGERTLPAEAGTRLRSPLPAQACSHCLQ